MDDKMDCLVLAFYLAYHSMFYFLQMKNAFMPWQAVPRLGYVVSTYLLPLGVGDILDKLRRKLNF